VVEYSREAREKVDADGRAYLAADLTERSIQRFEYENSRPPTDEERDELSEEVEETLSSLLCEEKHVSHLEKDVEGNETIRKNILRDRQARAHAFGTRPVDHPLIQRTFSAYSVAENDAGLPVERYKVTEALRYQYPRSVEMAMEAMPAAEAEAAVKEEERVAEEVETLLAMLQAWWGSVGGDGYEGMRRCEAPLAAWYAPRWTAGPGPSTPYNPRIDKQDRDACDKKMRAAVAGVRGSTQGHNTIAAVAEEGEQAGSVTSPEADLLLLLRHARSQSESEALEATIVQAWGTVPSALRDTHHMQVLLMQL
jgi:hypothetical protein